MINKIASLIKFGKKEHMKIFINKGLIRFSPIKNFSKSNENGRGDELEGAFNIMNEELLEIKCEHPIVGNFTLKPLPGSLWKLVESNDDSYSCFSSYAITKSLFEEKDNHSVDSEMSSLGGYAVFILNHTEFLNRVSKKLNSLNTQFWHKLISYQDLNKKGTIKSDFFTKDILYSYQSEHRILIKSQDDNPTDIKIGSLKDICLFPQQTI
jgi:hypothetical protein